MLEELIGVPVLGVIPWMDVELEDEDSVTERFEKSSGAGDLDVVVVKLGHISNFTDFQSLALQPGVRVRYASTAKDLEGADLIVLPGTKNTIEDLIDLRNRGMVAAIIRHARSGGMVIGILCCYAAGTLWYALGYLGGSGMGVGLVLVRCVLPYLIPDGIKLVLAYRLAQRLKRFV